MRKLAIFGAGGHGKVIADTALLAGWQEVVFFDDSWPGLSTNGRWPVIGDRERLQATVGQFDGVIVGIGDCRLRLEIQSALYAAGAIPTTIVHPQACLSPYAVIGPGTVVFGGASINVDAILGDACIVNTGASIDHDCRLGDAVHISPGVCLAGNVDIGECSWVGIGAVVRQDIRITADVLVGAGAVVVKDIDAAATVVGNPAVSLEKN